MKSLNKELYRKTSRGSIVLLINLCAFGLFFLRDIFATRFFGLNNRMDSVYLGVMIPSLAANFLFQPLSDLLIPKYQYRIMNGINIFHFYLNILVYTVLVSLIISLGIYVFKDQIASLLAFGFTEESRQLVSYYVYKSIPIVFLGGMIISTNIFLNSINQYIYTSSANILVPIVSIMAIQLCGHQYGEITFVNGMIIGQVLNFLSLLVLLVIKGKSNQSNYTHKGFKFVKLNRTQVFQYFSQNLVNLCFYGFNTISASFGTHFNEGTTSLIILVNKLIGFFTNLFNNTFSSVLMPYFSKIYFNDKNRFQSENKKFIYLLTILGVVAIFLIYLSSGLIAHLLFFSSKITPAQSVDFIHFLEIGVFQIPLLVTMAICFKWLTIYSEFRMLSLFSSVALLIDFGLNIFLKDYYGTVSILLAPFLTLVVIMLSIIVFMYKKDIGIKGRDVGILSFIWIALGLFLILVLV